MQCLLRLQEIFQSIKPTQVGFEIRVVRRVHSPQDALAFLRELEKNNRWARKYVVLDCSSDMAKDLIIGHVRDIQMGRRNYHYLLSGLVMDERWEENVKEFGAVNITGFQDRRHVSALRQGLHQNVGHSRSQGVPRRRQQLCLGTISAHLRRCEGGCRGVHSSSEEGRELQRVSLEPEDHLRRPRRRPGHVGEWGEGRQDLEEG
ncbi:glutamate receptor 1-like [Penaeus monodon]|uniref:glutamate receptor 1-like n=1 Tax=Penaeus monodon TaxID=6687 RepID=UPI0018A714BA|nr:glutamate receptor 1-like [Penaeus monodon]